MMYKREDYKDFLSTEYQTQMRVYENLIATKATLLKQKGKVFVGKFVGFRGDFAIFKVRKSSSMPLRNSFWTASYFIDAMGSYKNWGDFSWEELREQYQGDYSDAFCAWLSKSDDDDFCLVGIKNLTISFAKTLREQNPIIAFGPKDPPLRYLLNLSDIVCDTESKSLKSVLDFDESGTAIWNPRRVSFKEDLNDLIEESLSVDDFVVVQGPPGTGKTYRMAKLAAKLLEEKKSVLVTALTNEALKVLASKDDLKVFLEADKISKTSLTVDEHNALPALVPNVDNSCNAAPGHLSLATFYISSGWAIESEDGIPPFDYVIVDEASQALLPMLAASKKLGGKIIWIGDQKQLSPIVLTSEDVINKRGWSSIVKGFDTVCNSIKMPEYMLVDTFRLTKRGAEFTGLFYNNELNSVSKTTKIDTVIPGLNVLGGPVLVNVDLKIGDKTPDNGFDVVFDITKRILDISPESNISILSKFNETVNGLQKIFLTRLNSVDIPDNIKIETVDKIQGMTIDYAIFFIPNASVGFSIDSELFNVATSRSEYNTIIIADKRILKNYMSSEVRKFLLKLEDNKFATFLPSEHRSIETNDIKVTVLGKINLPEHHLNLYNSYPSL